MKTINKIKYVLLALAVFCLCFAFLNFKFANAQQEYTFELSSNLNKKYVVGDVVEIPTALYAGKEAEFVIKLPSGAFSDSKNLKLIQYGEYVIEYSAKNPESNNIVKHIISFDVHGDYFTVNGKGTTEFKTLSNGKTGIYASLTAGDSIRFNDVIDLEQYDALGLLFKMEFMPAVTGEADVIEAEIKFVDAYDENNFILINLKQYQDAYAYEHLSSFVNVKFNDSDYVGLFRTKNGKYEYDGEKCTAYVNHLRYGANVSISMTGSHGGNRETPLNGTQPFSFAFDEETGMVRSCVYSQYRPISDLHNLSLYGKPFKGFTDNKIKIEITPKTYSKASCGLFFTEFNGVKFTQSSYNDFTASEKPTIDLNLEGLNESSLPKARKGVSYKVFDAQGFSAVFGQLPVDVKVFYGYQNANKIRVNLVDGKFIPTVGGIYTIEYSVSDIFGNKTVKTVQVEAVDVQPSINVEFENEIDYNGTFIVAEKIKLFDSIINQQSAYGDISIKTYAELKSNPSVKYELTYENGYSFTPLYSGAYDIVIEISDYSLTEIIEKELMVDVADVVYYQQVAPFPNKLIKNGTYNLDVIKAYSLASGEPVEVELELSVFNDSNSTEEVVNASNMVISANRNIKLTYKPVGLDFTAKPFEVELGVLRTGLYEKTLVMRNYFYAEAGNLSFSADTEGISCEITNKVNDIASFYFANILAGHDFYLNLFPLVDEGSYIPFDRLNCYLYDATNSTNFVKASFISQDGMWFVSLNDGDLVKIFDSWGEEDCLELNFNSQKNVFIFDNLYTEKGVEFFGTDNQAIFRDGIILKLEILATNDCQGIKIEKINNQVISSASIDFTPAIIDMTHDNNAGEKKIGETIKLEKFVGYDVLTPNVKTVVTVQYRPTKESMWTFVKSVDEVVLKNADASRGYEFVLDKYGEYNVNVKVVDDIVTDNGASRSYTIFVNDYNKPVVNITSKTTSGKVGESIKLAKFETEKNLSELSYYFVIVDVDGYYNFTKETSFTANKAGKYKVTLVVLDGNYNMAQVSYNIMVK